MSAPRKPRAASKRKVVESKRKNAPRKRVASPPKPDTVQYPLPAHVRNGQYIRFAANDVITATGDGIVVDGPSIRDKDRPKALLTPGIRAKLATRSFRGDWVSDHLLDLLRGHKEAPPPPPNTAPRRRRSFWERLLAWKGRTR